VEGGTVTHEPLRLSRVDPRVVGIVVALCTLGIVVQASAREAAVEGSLVTRIDFLGKQVRWYGAGILAAALVLAVPYRRILDHAWILYGLGLLLLVGVLVAGVTVKGARRWIPLGSFHLQPSEVMKVGFLLALARYIRFRDDRRTFKGILVPFAIAGAPMGLILLQPDLGTALLFVPVLVAMLYASGTKPRHMGLVLGLAAALSPVVFWVGLHEYQRQRVVTFGRILVGVATPAEVQVEAWQAEQSRLAVAGGGVLGQGWAEGAQNRSGAVPEHHTDFVFTVLAEEHGLLGVALLLALYGMLLVFLAGIASRARDPAGRLLVVGVIALLACQAVVNLAMTVGLGPITGVPLPFVTYGGASVLATFAAVALALNVAARPGFELGSSDFA
jgi:rod shape determining protein RodA